MAKDAKIFGIGLSKTGTSSLAQALQRLGFRTKDCMGAARYVAGDLSSLDMDTILAHDALTDTPIPSFYRELDARFPRSKFILTVRERSGWLQSCKKQFNARAAAAQSEAHRRLFEDLYGTNAFNEEQFARGYDRFVANVADYFRGRPQDLLVMNISAGDGWEKLCPFLGQPIPDTPFPKANVTSIRRINIDDLVSVAETGGRELLKRFGGRIEPAAQQHHVIGSLMRMNLLDRAMQVALGRDATDAARNAAHRAIVAGLRKLSADIPVLSPIDELPAYDERRRLNHVWLVDPLDGRAAFANGSVDFSVNVALIEDGRPIYGVVHQPAKGVTYFGRAGKGAFRRSSSGTPARLASPIGEFALSESMRAREDGDDGQSRALELCALLDRSNQARLVFPPAREWRVAAAHAVLSAAGVRITCSNAESEFSYNTEQLAVPGMTVGATELA